MKTANMKEYQRDWFVSKKEDTIFLDKRRKQYTEWYAQNKDKRKEYRKQYEEQNREIINEKRRIKSKKKLQNDPKYKLRIYLSNSINRQLSKIGSNKSGLSSIDYLPFNIDDLKAHLEKQFESWMTWSNRGKYNSKTWNDNDPSTWTWQMDHIIPHTNFNYSSMTDQKFKECWSLSNLRPISSKTNILKGSK